MRHLLPIHVFIIACAAPTFAAQPPGAANPDDAPGPRQPAAKRRLVPATDAVARAASGAPKVADKAASKVAGKVASKAAKVAAASRSEPANGSGARPAVKKPKLPHLAQIVPADAKEPPAWLYWLGWSEDGTRFAVRQGPYHTGNRNGQPLWIARIDARRIIVDRAYRTRGLKPALRKRRIMRRGWVFRERVSANDTLLRTRDGQLFAIVLRGSPPTVSVLRREAGDYVLIATAPVRSPAFSVDASAFETPDHGTLAVVAQTGVSTSKQATLFIVPVGAPGATTSDAPPRRGVQRRPRATRQPRRRNKPSTAAARH